MPPNPKLKVSPRPTRSDKKFSKSEDVLATSRRHNTQSKDKQKNAGLADYVRVFRNLWWVWCLILLIVYVVYAQYTGLHKLSALGGTEPLSAAKSTLDKVDKVVKVPQRPDQIKNEHEERDTAIRDALVQNRLKNRPKPTQIDKQRGGATDRGAYHYEDVIHNFRHQYDDSVFVDPAHNVEASLATMKQIHSVQELEAMEREQRFPDARTFAFLQAVVLASMAKSLSTPQDFLAPGLPAGDKYFRATETPHMPHTIFRPFATRLIVPDTTKIVVFGDLHGSFKGLLHDLKAVGDCIEYDTLSVKAGCRLLFLGDFVDRGERSVEVFYTIMLLRAINGDLVTVNRGNHEDVNLCIHYGLGAEVTQKYGDNRSFVLGRLLRLFQFLPSVVYIGTPDGGSFNESEYVNPQPIDATDEVPNISTGNVHRDAPAHTAAALEQSTGQEAHEAVVVPNKETPASPAHESADGLGGLVHFMQASHGVVEWGYLPTRLLAAPHHWAANGTETLHELLGKIDRESTLIKMKTENPKGFAYIMRMLKQDPELLKQFTGSFTPESPSRPLTLGVCWSDLLVKGTHQARPPFMYVPGRGIAFDVSLLHSLFRLSSTPTTAILHGVIRGHQHNDAAGPMLTRLLKAHGAVDIYGNGDGVDEGCPEVAGARLPDRNGFYWIMTMISASESYLGLDANAYGVLTVSSDWNLWQLEHRYQRLTHLDSDEWDKCVYGPAMRYNAGDVHHASR